MNNLFSSCVKKYPITTRAEEFFYLVTRECTTSNMYSVKTLLIIIIIKIFDNCQRKTVNPERDEWRDVLNTKIVANVLILINVNVIKLLFM